MQLCHNLVRGQVKILSHGGPLEKRWLARIKYINVRRDPYVRVRTRLACIS